MKTGLYISGIGHGLLILWVLLGGVFSGPRPEPVEVAQVSIVSGAEFAALSAPASAPRAEVAAPAPVPVPPSAPERPAQTPIPDTVPETPRPSEPAPPAPEAAPDVSALAPLPETEVADQAPVQPAPPSADDGATLLPENARPRPVPRVAPLPAAPPAPDAKVDDTVVKATKPAQQAELTAPPVEESTAPEEAATEIVTEAEESDAPDTAVTASIRPRARPDRAAPPTAPVAAKPSAQPAQTSAPAPATPASPAADPIAAALAEALTSGATNTTGSGTAPVGPPLTQGETDALRVAVGKCWNVGSLSSEAMKTSVVVGVSMAEDGKPKTETIRMISFSGGSETAAKQTYESARRAIIRCGASGFELPAAKYTQWRDIEMTFNPEKMRIK
ncbi:energy transducer TonB [Actibacterium sp. D379-3]